MNNVSHPYSIGLIYLYRWRNGKNYSVLNLILDIEKRRPSILGNAMFVSKPEFLTFVCMFLDLEGRLEVMNDCIENNDI